MANLQHVNRLIVFTLLTLAFVCQSWAGVGRTTYQAKIIKPDGYPLEATSVNFKFTILDPTGSCVLYSEEYTAVNMNNTGGLIFFSLGAGNRTYPATGAATLASVFDNSVVSFACQSPGLYTPTSADNRKIVMQFNDGNGWQTLPAMAINAVPYAMYAGKAENSVQLNGKPDSAFVEYSSLASLNCQSNEAIKFNGVSFSCIPVGSGDGGITSVTTSGTVLLAGGTASAPVISIQAASMSQDGYLTSLDYAEFKAKLSASSTQIINTLGYAPVSGAAVTTQINNSNLSGDVSGTISSNSVVSVGGKTANQISASVNDSLAATSSATADTLVKRNSSGNSTFNDIYANAAKINYVDIYKPSTSFNIRLQAPTSLSANYNLTLPSTAGVSGQVISTDGAGNLSWINAATGSVTSVNANAPLSSTGGSTPTISITQATSSTNGYLSSSDWNAFNNKADGAATVASFTTLSNNINAVSSSVAAMTSSQWTTSGSSIFYNSGNVGIGTSSPSFKLEVSGASTSDKKIGINGKQVLYLPDQSSGAFIGSLFVGDGGSSVSHTFGSHGYYNTGVGIGALYSNTTGSHNTANGYYVLQNNTTGYSNSANGYYALQSNTNGFENTANGSYALQFNITGYHNTANGSFALQYATGSNNTAVGYGAGSAITTGSNNVILGSDDGSLIATLSNYVLIADGVGNRRMTIDNNGRAGIGTTIPVTKLDVSGGIRISMESATCAASYAGTLRYNAGNVEYCNGSTWSAFGVSGTVLQSLNGSASGTQSFAIGTGSIAPVFNTSNGVHTLNIPYASVGTTTAGLISNADYATFTNKMNATSAAVITALGYTPASSTALGSFLQISNNFSDIASAAVARINLGLGLLATKSQIDLSSADVSGTLSVANLLDSGVAAATYTKVTVDNKGRVTSGSQFSASDITTALGYTPANSATVVSSQWNTSGTTINYMSGNVGIGTTSPTNLLHVNGSGTVANFSHTNPNYNLALGNLNSSGNPFVLFRGSNSTTNTIVRTSTESPMGLLYGGTGYANNLISLVAGTTGAAGSATAISDVMTWMASGNVGIGTANPAHRLDVVGGSVANDTSFYFTQLNSASAKFNAVQLDPYVSVATSGSETTGLSIGTKIGGTTTWSVDFADNIYTYVPINANAGSTYLNRNVASTSAHSLAFYKRRPSGSVLANDNLAWIPGYGHTGSGWASTYSAAIGMRATENITGSAAGGQLWFETTPNGTTTPQNRMTIDQNGYVGIGLTAPSNILSISTLTSADGISLSGVQTAGNTTNVAIRTNLGAGSFNGLSQAGDSGIIYSGLAVGTAKGFVIAPWIGSTAGIRMDGSGNVGIGTATPNATLEVKGHLAISSASTPALSSCGTSPTISGNDIRGTVTTGGGAVSCTITFSSAFSTSPYCVIGDVGANNGAYLNSISTSAMVVNLGQNKTFNYICMQ